VQEHQAPVAGRSPLAELDADLIAVVQGALETVGQGIDCAADIVFAGRLIDQAVGGFQQGITDRVEVLVIDRSGRTAAAPVRAGAG
jgi:hypothetical protein